MIHNDIQNQLQLLIKVSAPPLIEVSETQLKLPELVPGQRLPATVLASLPNGRFQVLISDHVLDLNLPKNTLPGDKIDLTFVSNQPRLTFALSRDIPLPATPAGQSQVSISESAKFLGSLLQKVAEHTEGQASPLSKLSAPLLTGAPENTQNLAQVLHKALSQSGLFYESHQAQWVSGERPIADLMQEPQAKLSQTPSGLNVNTPDAATQSKAASQTASLVSPNPSTLPNEPVHPHTIPLVQQQLDVLDTRQLVWQGQVWPGQVMDWRIVEEEAGRNQEANAAPAWQTQLYLKFPKLGEVTAVLALTVQGIRVNFNVADAETAGTLQKNQPVLQNAMQEAGLNLIGVTVERHEKA